MSAYDNAEAAFLRDSANPPRFVVPTPSVPVAQSRPAPINTSSTGIFQPPEKGNIDGIITADDARSAFK